MSEVAGWRCGVCEAAGVQSGQAVEHVISEHGPFERVAIAWLDGDGAVVSATVFDGAGNVLETVDPDEEEPPQPDEDEPDEVTVALGLANADYRSKVAEVLGPDVVDQTCPYCSGLGFFPIAPPADAWAHTCAHCQGYGSVTTGSKVSGNEKRACPVCNGAGFKEQRPAPAVAEQPLQVPILPVFAPPAGEQVG